MPILLIDDDDTGRKVAAYNLARAGHQVDEAADGRAGLGRFDPARHEVVVTDLKMPGVDGLTVLRGVRERAGDTPVVVVTAFGSVEAAVEAMRAGAWDFIEKPFTRERLEVTVARAVEMASLRRENRRLAPGVERPIVTEAPSMRRVVELADRVAGSDATVLVTGESGAGKELVARRIHARSARAVGPFVAVNCAAIPSEILESELFGHARGAFSGATRDREGRFRKASGGTLLLDEVAEIPPDLQAKLLRVIQEGEVDVVGRDEPVRIDVRIVAATNRDLAERVAAGAFREDLYYRLNVIEIRVPPLRERVEDIGPLARRFLDELAWGRDLDLPRDVLRALESRAWSGNVRELRNACERLAVLCPGTAVRLEDLPPEPRVAARRSWIEQLPAGLSLVDLEREVVCHTVARCGGNLSQAARDLGVPRHVLAYRVEKYGIRRDA